MRGFKFIEKFLRRPNLPFFRVLLPLMDTFLRIDGRVNIEQAFMYFSIQHHGALPLSYSLHEVIGTSLEGRQRLNLINDI